MNLEYLIPLIAIVLVIALAGVAKRKKKTKKIPTPKTPENGLEPIRVVGNKLNTTLSCAKWFTVQDICLRYGDGHITQFLDFMKFNGLNCVLVKTTGFLLHKDGKTWNEAWKDKYHWFIRQCNVRDIYVQVNLMDFWTRPKDGGMHFHEGPGGMFEWWSTSDWDRKRLYIENHVKEFVEYPNVFFELGNEMGHGGADKNGFIHAAKTQYLPEYRKWSQGKPIGISEHDMWVLPVDILEGHHVAVIKSYDRPFFFNEIAGNITAYEDSFIRNSANINTYKGIINKCASVGAVGCAAATWLDIRQPLNAPATEVLKHLGGKF